MAQINEKETSFELVEALLKYIETLQVAGAVLIFLPGWNLIYSMQRHLETNPHFGSYHTITSQIHRSHSDLTAAMNTSTQSFICLFSGSNRYRILPLHSQIPREEQRKVFEPVPHNVTKVRFSRMEKYRVDFV